MKVSIFSVIAIVGLLSACEYESPEKHEPANAATSDLITGQKLFAKSCARCHGRGGKGTNQGPPFIHKIYEPNHHGDAAFIRAAQQGVRAHHWKFGDMPPVKDVSRSDLMHIIKYIRTEQRKAGIH